PAPPLVPYTTLFRSDVGDRGHHAYRHELRRVVRELAEQVLIDDERPGSGGEQGIAVGLGLVDELGADVAARARAIFDQYRLPPLRPELLGEDAGQQIGAASRGIRHDDPDRPRRAGLRVRGWSECEPESERGGKQEAANHVYSSVSATFYR